MLSVIHCDNCGMSGIFEFNLGFIFSEKSCSECHNYKSESWNYYFCNLKCFFNWIKEKKIETEGFECKACQNQENVSTGWWLGFKEWGTCLVCRGTKRVKGKVTILEYHKTEVS
jgi:hypothetical protein